MNFKFSFLGTKVSKKFVHLYSLISTNAICICTFLFNSLGMISENGTLLVKQLYKSHSKFL